jgi:hypothetical protein
MSKQTRYLYHHVTLYENLSILKKLRQQQMMQISAIERKVRRLQTDNCSAACHITCNTKEERHDEEMDVQRTVVREGV